MTQFNIARSFTAQLQDAIEIDARASMNLDATREERVKALENDILCTLLNNDKLTAIVMKVLETGGFAIAHN